MKVIEQNVLKTKVMDWNAAYFGESIYEWMNNAGKGIARILNTKYKIRNTKLKIGIFCGLGNNGGDGFAAARYLYPKHNVKVYLFGQPNDIRTEESQRHWQMMLDRGVEAVVLGGGKDVKSYFAKSPKDLRFDVIVDCLLGTGVTGQLREPIASGVKLFNKIRARKIAIDFPTKGIKKTDLVISMQFPKTKNAEVVDLQSEHKFLSKIGWGEFKALNFPGHKSKKGDVGNLLMISGFEQYHGAMLYALKAASKIIDIVYVYTSDENQKYVNKLKSKTAEFVAIDDWRKALNKVEVILIGPGLGRSKFAYEMVERVLEAKKKVVMDADAISLIDKKLRGLLRSGVILTPHKKEFERAFGLKPTDKNVEKVMKKSGLTVVLKGAVDVVGNRDWGIKYNYTGNVGMTKGGTGDVLAGLTAALYSVTDDPYLAAASGAFVNGLAGDEIYKKVGRFYDADDLLKQLPKTLVKLLNSK